MQTKTPRKKMTLKLEALTVQSLVMPATAPTRAVTTSNTCPTRCNTEFECSNENCNLETDQLDCTMYCETTYC